MKNAIMYNYNFDNIKLMKSINGYKFKYNNIVYALCKISSTEEVLEIFELLKKTSGVDKYKNFIFNKDKSIFTYIGSDIYVLLKENDKFVDIVDSIINNEKIVSVDNYSKYKINRSNWYTLWTNKQDYFEYQMRHLKGKYFLIEESFDYYTGMCENAISYFNYNVNKEKFKEKMFLCHSRISEEGFFNPLLLVMDYKVRDIAEYIKYLFFEKKEDRSVLIDFVDRLLLDRDDSILLFCRLLYPSYYFDKYEKVVNGIIKENELIEIVFLSNQYEKLLQIIYEHLNKKHKIPKIEWI